MVVDEDGQIIARPLPKFFNLSEITGWDELQEQEYELYKKIDGTKVKVQNSKNFISWIYTYIKCIIHKLSKKRGGPLLCTYFVPNFRYSRYIH